MLINWSLHVSTENKVTMKLNPTRKSSWVNARDIPPARSAALSPDWGGGYPHPVPMGGGYPILSWWGALGYSHARKDGGIPIRMGLHPPSGRILSDRDTPLVRKDEVFCPLPQVIIRWGYPPVIRGYPPGCGLTQLKILPSPILRMRAVIIRWSATQCW